MIVPAYLPYYVVAGTIGMMAAILFGLSRALRDAGWAADERIASVRAAAITVVGWFLLTIALASVDAYRAAAERIPTNPIWNSRSGPDRLLFDLAIAAPRPNH